MPFRTGLARLISTHLEPHSVIAVAGDSAAQFAESLIGEGAPPLAIEADRFAILSDALNPPAVGRVRDLPVGAADVVILRRAWVSPPEVRRALTVASRAVRPGGEVVAADLDVPKILAGPGPRYPTRLLYLAEPEAARRLASSTASPGFVGAEAVRAGLLNVESFNYDDVLGEHESVAGLWSEIRRRGWRGSSWLPQDHAASLLDDVAASMTDAVPAGWVQDREPWYAVFGRRG